MRILFITPRFPPEIGGVEKHVSHISKELLKYGIHINIITSTYRKDLNPNEQQDGMQVYRILLTNPNQCKFITIFNFIKVWSFLFKKFRILFNHNIIHLHDYQTFLWFLPFIPLIKILFRKQIFITFHGFEGYPITILSKSIRRMAEIVVDGNICVGSYIVKWYGTNPNYTVIGGVDFPKNPSNLPVKETAVFIGRLAEDTSILYYVESLRILKEKYRVDLTLHICGDGPLRSKIEEFKILHSLNIFLHGFVKNPEDFLAKVRYAFVSGYLAILEAMSYRRPVFSIYSNELKRDYLYSIPNAEKLMFISSSAEELAEQLYEVIKNPENIMSILEQSYVYAIEQSWKTMADKYLRLYIKR